VEIFEGLKSSQEVKGRRRGEEGKHLNMLTGNNELKETRGKKRRTQKDTRKKEKKGIRCKERQRLKKREGKRGGRNARKRTDCSCYFNNIQNEDRLEGERRRETR